MLMTLSSARFKRPEKSNRLQNIYGFAIDYLVLQSPIVVTGMGVCCAGASSLSSLWMNAMQEKVYLKIRTLPSSGKKLPVYDAGELPLSPSDRHATRRADRAAALSMVATREAWKQAGHDKKLNAQRVGVFVGSSRGPAGLNDLYSTLGTQNASDSVYTTFSSIASLVANAVEAEGCALTVSATCTSGAVALCQALQALNAGALDVAIVGGVDAPLVNSLLEQFISTGITSLRTDTDALRPFDKDRCGTVLGEGAAFLVLEREDFAKARNAIVLGIIAAVSIQCQSYQRTTMNSDGGLLRQVILNSLTEAKIDPQEVGLIHLHGTGTKINDQGESGAIRAVFGAPEQQPYSWGSKAITGHTLGASSLLQVVLALESLRHRVVPRTVNCFKPDPQCEIRLNTSASIPCIQSVAVCSTSGLWGNVSSVVLSVD